MFKSIIGWLTAGWQQLAVMAAVVVAASGVSLVYGIDVGRNAVLAGEAKANAEALRSFKSRVDDMLAEASRQITDDFNARLRALDDVAGKLRKNEEVSNANAEALGHALRGRFVLTPDERLQFECIRRPADPRCTATPGAPVRAAVP